MSDSTTDSTLSASELRRRHQVVDNSQDFSTKHGTGRSKKQEQDEQINLLFYGAVGAFLALIAVMWYFMNHQ
jgi:hypothetical protein